MTRIFMNTWFCRFARKERLGIAALCEAVARADRGLIDADLGSGVIKQRVARPNAGKSGGYRTLLLFRSGDRAVFAFGFAKSNRGNIDPDDEARLKMTAKVILGLGEADLGRLVQTGALVEIVCDGQQDTGSNVS